MTIGPSPRNCVTGDLADRNKFWRNDRDTASEGGANPSAILDCGWSAALSQIKSYRADGAKDGTAAAVRSETARYATVIVTIPTTK